MRIHVRANANAISGTLHRRAPLYSHTPIHVCMCVFVLPVLLIRILVHAEIHAFACVHVAPQ
jgi:hypothetical protein